MMRKMALPLRNIAVADPEPMKCVPFLSIAMWIKSSPIAEKASFNTFEICLEATCSMQLYVQMAEIGVSLLAPRYNQIHWKMAVAACTEHNVMLP